MIKDRTFLVWAAAFLAAAGAGGGQAAAPETGGELVGGVRHGSEFAPGIQVMLCGLTPVTPTRRGGVEWEGCQATQTALTDQDGRYAFTGLPSGGYAVLAKNGDSWSYNGSPSGSGSAHVLLNQDYHIWIETYRVQTGPPASAKDTSSSTPCYWKARWGA